MRIDHVNLRCTDLEATRDFLVGVLGLKVGARPPFPFPGYWMYDETGGACVHLVQAREPAGAAGPVDHVAFRFDDIAAQADHMAQAGFPVTLKAVPGTDILQGFIKGPDGVQIEVQGRAKG